MARFKIGDFVRKRSGSEWAGFVVGSYSTKLTHEGYCVGQQHTQGVCSYIQRRPWSLRA